MAVVVVISEDSCFHARFSIIAGSTRIFDPRDACKLNSRTLPGIAPRAENGPRQVYLSSGAGFHRCGFSLLEEREGVLLVSIELPPPLILLAHQIGNGFNFRLTPAAVE